MRPIWIVLFGWLSMAAHCDYKISVLIYDEEDGLLESIITSVTNAFVEVFGTTSYRIGEHVIRATFVEAKRDRNRLATTMDVVCSNLLNSSLAAIVYSAKMHASEEFLSLVSSATYALSFYRLPLIGVMVRDAEFSKKKIYPNFVRPTAALSDEAFVMLHVLLRLQYRQVVVVSVKRDRNSDQFVSEFEQRRVEFKIIVQRYIEVETSDENLYEFLAENFEEVTSNIIVLFASESDAQKIFAASSEFTKTGKLWLVSESASRAENVPRGSLSPKLSQTPLSALRDSLTILKTALELVLESAEANNSTIVPPTDCDRDSIQAGWQEQANFIQRSICEINEPRIHFNRKCERIGVEYDILNFNRHAKLVGTMVGGRLKLDESDIEWAHGVKPLEITLPKHLRVVTVADPPFVYTKSISSPVECEQLRTTSVELSANDIIEVPGPWYSCPMVTPNSTQYFCCAGLAIDLLSNLSKREPNNRIDNGFTFSLHLNETYGAIQAAESDGLHISGMIGELDSDLADIAIGGLTINPDRERIIDFTEPWLYHGIQILEKSIPRDSPMQSFLQPLQSSLWTALFISVILVGLSIYCLDYKSPFERFYQDEHCGNVNFGEAMWFVFGVLLNSGVSEKTPRCCSARVLGIVWCGFCMIMVASYTANLAAFLVLDQPEKGLTGVTDPRLRNPSANFSFGTVLNSNVYQYFKRHVELSTMFRKMEAHNVRQASEAVHLLLNGTLDAFIWDSTRLEFEAARHCELRTRGSLFGRSAYGIGLQKHSPWTPHITSAILRMSESGVMENLDRKWIERNQKNCVVEVHKSPARLGLSNMKDIFILVSCGVVLGVILSSIEVAYGRRRAERGRRRIIASRYADKWLKMARQRSSAAYRFHYPRRYAVIRRGFSGAHRCTIDELRQLRHHRGLSVTRLRDDGILEPNHAFRDKPVVVYCSRCRNIVETDVHRETGAFAIVSSIVFAAIFLWPCSALPCFLDSFSDFVHICPWCTHKIGRFRRARSTQFYV